MSTDKEKLNQLLQKVDEIAVSINKISEELRSVSASLKSLAVGQITQPIAHTPPPKAYCTVFLHNTRNNKAEVS